MDLDAQQRIMPHLGSGERLQWTGRPKAGLTLQSGDIFLIPFSLLWSGGVFAGLWSALNEPNTPIVVLTMLTLFAVMGVHILIGRFFYDAWRRSRTYYGLTEQRVIIVSGATGRKAKSLNLKALQDISLSKKNDGTGTITLGLSPWPGTSWISSSWPGRARFTPPALERIPNAQDVYNQILAVQGKS